MKIESLWLQYKGKIQSFLSAKISDPTAREDVLQDIFLKTYSNINTLRSEQSIVAWLWQVTNRCIIDYYRQKPQSQSLPEEASLTDEAYMSNQQGSEVWCELTRCIEPFLQEMSTESAQLLAAIDINGKSQKQYAQECGIDYSTLKSRVQKSRGELKKLFQQCCSYELDAHGNIVEYQIKSGSCKNC